MHERAKSLIPEAKLKQTDYGLVPEGAGWYILNPQKSQWHKNEKFGQCCTFEGDQRFQQYGMNIHVLQPGQPNCHYHGEEDQENFLVLKGTCRLLIEGEERLLHEWDFVHCPPWTKHVFVGAGSGPCAILMIGGRTGKGVVYPTIDLAKRYKACPSEETHSAEISYADCPKWTVTKGTCW